MMSMERRGDITDIGVFSNRNNLFSSNSEAFASELLENLEEMFPMYYIYSGVFSVFKSTITHWRVTRCVKVNEASLIDDLSKQLHNVV